MIELGSVGVSLVIIKPQPEYQPVESASKAMYISAYIISLTDISILSKMNKNIHSSIINIKLEIVINIAQGHNF